MTCQRTLSMVNMTHHYQVEMGLCGHCLSSNSFLETERENTWFLYKKSRIPLTISPNDLSVFTRYPPMAISWFA
jgi:hypothetical protein